VSDPMIVQRLDAALEKVAFRKMDVRAIYLDSADREALTRWWTRKWRKQLGSKAEFIPLAYRDHPVRSGNNSIIYSTHGVGVTVPKRLSSRTREAA